MVLKDGEDAMNCSMFYSTLGFIKTPMLSTLSCDISALLWDTSC